MELVCKDIFVGGRGKMVTLIPIGDIHYGIKNCDEDKLLEIVDYIRKKDLCYWVGMGDVCEFINYTDKRFDPDSLDPKFLKHLNNLHLAQLTCIKNILKPIRSKCLGLIEGNHEETIKNKYHTSVTDILAYELETVNLKNTAMIRLVFRRGNTSKDKAQSVDIFVTHGHSSSRTYGGKINRVTDYAKHFDADIYLMGHVHAKMEMSDIRLFMGRSNRELRLFHKKRIYGVTGTFFKTYQRGNCSYSEKAGFAPTPTGVVKITIEPFTQEWIDGQAVDLPPHMHISA